MVEQLVWRFLEYRKKKQAVIIVTILTGLVAVWPAADEYTAARSRYNTARSELEETERQVGNLPKFTQLFEKRKVELAQLEEQAVNEAGAQKLRSELVQLVRETGCTMRRIRLGDPIRRDWAENDHPVYGVNAADRGAETPFQLETWQMTLQISGPMANVKDFLAKLSEVDRLIHTKSIALQRASQTSTLTALDMDLLLFDLKRKPA